jgi:hypothetical protein
MGRNQNIPGRLQAQRVAMRKIGMQFDMDSPEHRLVRAVLNCAVTDLGSKHHRAAALRFLLGDMRLVELCGVDPAWVRETLARCGIRLDESSVVNRDAVV